MQIIQPQENHHIFWTIKVHVDRQKELTYEDGLRKDHILKMLFHPKPLMKSL